MSGRIIAYPGLNFLLGNDDDNSIVPDELLVHGTILSRLVLPFLIERNNLRPPRALQHDATRFAARVNNHDVDRQ